jgi:hypothetical protein
MTSFRAGRKESKTVLYSEKHTPGAQTSQLHNTSTSNAISQPSVIVNNFVSGDASETLAGLAKCIDATTEPIFITEPRGVITPPEDNININNEPIEDKTEPEPARCLHAADEIFEQNPRLRICREVERPPPEFIIDVEFLRHVINTILLRYNITLNNKDIKAILGYFGDVTIETRKQVIKERAIGEAGCCGMTEKETEKIIDTIKKLYVESINNIKHVPSLIEFLHNIGISF